MPGEHEVKLNDPRYEEFSTKVTITAGKTTVISQTRAMHLTQVAATGCGRFRLRFEACWTIVR